MRGMLPGPFDLPAVQCMHKQYVFSTTLLPLTSDKIPGSPWKRCYDTGRGWKQCYHTGRDWGRCYHTGRGWGRCYHTGRDWGRCYHTGRGWGRCYHTGRGWGRCYQQQELRLTEKSMFFLSWLTALGSGIASVCLRMLTLSPVRMDWSIFSVVERIFVTRISAGILSPTKRG